MMSEMIDLVMMICPAVSERTSAMIASLSTLASTSADAIASPSPAEVAVALVPSPKMRPMSISTKLGIFV